MEMVLLIIYLPLMPRDLKGDVELVAWIKGFIKNL